jgi:hypothetical protein
VVINTPGPVEYREVANILMTGYLLHGKNPFSLNNQPLMNNNYGVFYNLVALPIVALFGNTLAVNRIITLFFILLSCAIVGWVLIKIKTSTPFAIAGGVLFLAFMLFYVGPITRGDCLGTFLFLVAGFVPFIQKFNTSSLILSGAMSILAFFTKPYFLFLSASSLFIFFCSFQRKRG